MCTQNLILKAVEDAKTLADGFRSLADSLQAVADAMASDEKTTDTSKEEPVAEENKTEPEVPGLTLEQVRAVLADKSRKGHTAEVKELLIKYGANKLSEISPENYKALLADAEVL